MSRPASPSSPAGPSRAPGPVSGPFHHQRWRALTRFTRHRMAVLAALVLALLVFLALLAPLLDAWRGVDAVQVDLLNRFAPASWTHPLGTDELGRDLLARLLRGGRLSLTVGLVAALTAAGLGTCIGLVAGYCGGRTDAALMRLTDSVIALPLLPLLIILAAVDGTRLGVLAELGTAEDASLYRIIAIVALAGWTTTARLVRGTTLAVRQRDYVRAAIALGASPLRVMRVHVLPNIAAGIVVATTLSIGNIILLESVLSFLGLGIQPPLPSWGNMLTNAQELIWSTPLLALYPGLLIFITVIACNTVGDGLQEALDPRA